MSKRNGYVTSALVRFAVIGGLMVIFLRIVLGLAQAALDFPSWTANLLALFGGGGIAYWVIYSRGGR